MVRHHVISSALAAVLVIYTTTYLSAQTTPDSTGQQPSTADLEQRIRCLESKLDALTSKQATEDFISAPKTFLNPEDQVPTGTGQSDNDSTGVQDKSRFTAGWDNGFFVQSMDEQFKLGITGQIQSDFRTFSNSGDRVDFDNFFLRRARLGIEANILRYYEFRFLPDYAQGQSRIQDSYINIHYWDEFQIEAGKFKQPFSYEQLLQDRFTPLMERSLFDQLVPARDVGVMLHGKHLIGDRIDWGISVSNGAINGDGDANTLKDYAFLGAVRPFKGIDSLSFLDLLQFGFTATMGVEQEAANAVLRTPAGTPFFNFVNNVRADGLRIRYSPEIVYFYESFGFAAQYFRQDQRFRTPDGLTLNNVSYNGWYIMGSYLLTGEKRISYSEAIDPRSPFDPRPGSFGIGAWEVIGRISRLKVGASAFTEGPAGLADPVRSSSGATEWTLGINWYLNSWVRTQVNYEHDRFDLPVQLGPRKTDFFSRSNALMVRLQLVF